jgi:hypothetical protein
MSELLLGCGRDRRKKVALPGRETWSGLVTLDRYIECEPDVVWDLDDLRYPFVSNEFSEIHAYCVLEHCGRQGDWRFFFNQFSELWRIAKESATFHGITPLYSSPWAWGDPSHTRIIGLEAIAFLSQKVYDSNAAIDSPMSDFRWYYRADWELVASSIYGSGKDQLAFVLRAIK